METFNVRISAPPATALSLPRGAGWGTSREWMQRLGKWGRTRPEQEERGPSKEVLAPHSQSPTKPQFTYLVEGAIGATPLCLHHHIGMQKVGRNHVWHEGRVFVLEDHSDDVVPDMPLPLQLSTGPQAFIAWLQGVGQGCPDGVGGGASREHIQRCVFPAHPPNGKTCLKMATSDRWENGS